jgi:anthranilate synthase/aminodeoxychorismate synthase-like glutamine amidotransferase
MIDNYDSFTYNLVQALRVLGAELVVHRNDALSVEAAADIDCTHLVVSPGPGHPAAAGISVDLIRVLAGRVPVLGVCLGHQSIVAAFGGEVGRAPVLMHGKSSLIRHDGLGIYSDLPDPLEVGRYHSLAADPARLPDCLTVTARSDDGVIMGVRHRELAVEGLQFHPESVLTPAGPRLLANFLAVPAGSGFVVSGNREAAHAGAE